MKIIDMTCQKCNGTMVLDKNDSSSIFCPYCGNSEKIMIESDKVKIAKLRAETERLDISLSYRERQDYRDENRSKRRIQLWIIVFIALVVLGLLWVFMHMNPVDYGLNSFIG